MSQVSYFSDRSGKRAAAKTVAVLLISLLAVITLTGCGPFFVADCAYRSMTYDDVVYVKSTKTLYKRKSRDGVFANPSLLATGIGQLEITPYNHEIILFDCYRDAVRSLTEMNEDFRIDSESRPDIPYSTCTHRLGSYAPGNEPDFLKEKGKIEIARYQQARAEKAAAEHTALPENKAEAEAVIQATAEETENTESGSKEKSVETAAPETLSSTETDSEDSVEPVAAEAATTETEQQESPDLTHKASDPEPAANDKDEKKTVTADGSKETSESISSMHGEEEHENTVTTPQENTQPQIKPAEDKDKTEEASDSTGIDDVQPTANEKTQPETVIEHSHSVTPSVPVAAAEENEPEEDIRACAPPAGYASRYGGEPTLEPTPQRNTIHLTKVFKDLF